MYRIKNVKVSALACALPGQKFSLTEYAPDLIDEKTAGQIERVSGFHSLRIAPDKMTTSDLCAVSAHECLSSLWGGGVRNLIALIFISQTPDYYIPATSHILQTRLGLPESTICIDINEGCSGFITGLYTAGLIAEQYNGNVLLTGGDTLSKLTSPEDRALKSILSDAGYAAVISPGGNGEMKFMFEGYGERADALIVENSRHRKTDNPRNNGKLFMDGAAIMNFTLSDVPRVMKNFLDESGLTVNDITLFALHQANKLMLRTIAKKMGVPEEKMPFTAGDIGNTSSASIPLMLSGLSGSADMKCVMCAGFGMGLSVGVCTADLRDTKFLGIKEI